MIRTLEPHEVGLHRELRLRALRDAPDSFGETFADVAGRPGSYWEDLTRSVTEPGRHVMFVAYEGEHVHGATYGLVDPAQSKAGRVGGIPAAMALYRQAAFRETGGRRPLPTNLSLEIVEMEREL